MSRALLTPRAPGRARSAISGESASSVAGSAWAAAAPAARTRRSAGRRRCCRPPLAAVALTAAASSAPATGLLTTPRFAVVAVEVRGASRRAARADPGGLAASTHGHEPLAHRSRAGARRAWRRCRRSAAPTSCASCPNRVAIVVEERRPFTLVHAGRLHWLDEDGRLLGAESRGGDTAGARDQRPQRGRAGHHAHRARPAGAAAIALIRALLRSGSTLASEISEIDMSRPRGTGPLHGRRRRGTPGRRGVGRAPGPPGGRAGPGRDAGRARRRPALPRPGRPVTSVEATAKARARQKAQETGARRRTGRRHHEDLRGDRPSPSPAAALDVIGVGTAPSRGLRRGVVVNIDSTVEAIKQAVAEAEQMAGVEVSGVYAGVAGGHIRGAQQPRRRGDLRARTAR